MTDADAGSSGGTDNDDAARARQRPIRETILYAAHACLVEVGFEHITTRRIAEAAGVNVATLHYYFGSKEALLAEAVGAGIAASEKALRAVTAEAPNAAEALRAGMVRAWELVREQPGRLRFDLVVRGFRNAEARKAAIAIWHVLEDLTCEILERHVLAGGKLAYGLTPESLSKHIVSASDGVVLRYALTRDDVTARLSMGLIVADALRLMGVEDEWKSNEYNGF